MSPAQLAGVLQTCCSRRHPRVATPWQRRGNSDTFSGSLGKSPDHKCHFHYQSLMLPVLVACSKG